MCNTHVPACRYILVCHCPFSVTSWMFSHSLNISPRHIVICCQLRSLHAFHFFISSVYVSSFRKMSCYCCPSNNIYTHLPLVVLLSCPQGVCECVFHGNFPSSVGFSERQWYVQFIPLFLPPIALENYVLCLINQFWLCSHETITNKENQI